MKPLVYLAGPYTNPDPVENTNKFCRIGDQFLQDGIVTPVIPHLSLTWQLVSPKSYQEWLDYDLELLAHCHALFRVPGDSPGADGEVSFADDHGIPVFTTFHRLYAWARPPGE